MAVEQMELFTVRRGMMSQVDRSARKAQQRRERLEVARRMLEMDGRGHHQNSKEAFHDGEGKRIFSRRQAQIYEWLLAHGPATDREVRDGLFPGRDMNSVRPRISELLDAGALIETGRVKCRETGLNVRRVAVAK